MSLYTNDTALERATRYVEHIWRAHRQPVIIGQLYRRLTGFVRRGEISFPSCLSCDEAWLDTFKIVQPPRGSREFVFLRRIWNELSYEEQITVVGYINERHIRSRHGFGSTIMKRNLKRMYYKNFGRRFPK